MATSTINEMIAAIKTALDAVDGIGTVDTRWGGKPTWEERQKPKQAYWVVTWSGYREEGAGISTQSFQRPAYRIRGWMPFSTENPNTTPVWYGLVEGVLTALREKRSIGQNLTLPQVVVPPDTVSLEGTKDEVACHKVEIEVMAKQHRTYTTS